MTDPDLREVLRCIRELALNGFPAPGLIDPADATDGALSALHKIIRECETALVNEKP